MSPLPIKTGHLFIGAAIILGLVTMLMVGAMNRNGGKNKLRVEKIETVSVVVPMVPVLKGETLTVDKLRVVKWPKGYLPQGATYQTVSPLVGRVPLQDLMPGEPIYSQKLSAPDTDGLTALIPAGHRAITIAVTETKGVAGFVKPGDHVDILCTFSLSGKRDDGSRNKYYRTVTLVQDIEVLASAQTMVDDERDESLETPQGVVDGELKSKAQVAEDDKSAKSRRKKDEEKPKSDNDLAKERKAAEKAKRDAEKRAKLVSSVTIAVTPGQAQAIALAEEAGDLRLVMRAAKDILPESVEATESEDVVYPAGTKKPAPPPPPPVAMPRAFMAPPPPPKNEVEVIEGVDKRSVEF